MAPSRPRMIGSALGVVLIAFLVLAFAGPLVFSGTGPPPPPPVQPCPEQPVSLPGHHFTASERTTQSDYRCADLHGAVFDGIDLAQSDLGRADLRGASLRHTDLTQADLSGARLNGADLSFADLTQADLTGADLRGASLWLAGSIQTETSGARIGIVERGVLQLGYALVVAAVIMLCLSVVRLARGIRRPGRGSGRLRPGVARIGGLMLITPAVFLLNLVIGQLFTLWTVDLLRPVILAELVLVIVAGVEQFSPIAHSPDAPHGP